MWKVALGGKQTAGLAKSLKEAKRPIEGWINQAQREKAQSLDSLLCPSQLSKE